MRPLGSVDKEFIPLGDANCNYSVLVQESSVNLPSNSKQLENLWNSIELKQLTIDTSTIIDSSVVNIASNIIESGVLGLRLNDH